MTKAKLILIIVAVLALSGFAWLQIEDVSNFYAIQAKATALGTATPLAEFWRQSAGDALIIRDSRGTPRIQVAATSGIMSNLTLSTVVAPVIGYPTPGIICNKKSNTITDTAAYTSTVTAITTPIWASCSMSTITGDAYNCAASVGTPGAVSVIVRNNAATPAANAAGALVFWETCGTN